MIRFRHDTTASDWHGMLIISLDSPAQGSHARSQEARVRTPSSSLNDNAPKIAQTLRREVCGTTNLICRHLDLAIWRTLDQTPPQ